VRYGRGYGCVGGAGLGSGRGCLFFGMLVWRSVVGLEAVADPGIELGMESQVDPEVVEFVESVQSVDLVP
jgi:hypothetical protein